MPRLATRGATCVESGNRKVEGNEKKNNGQKIHLRQIETQKMA
jgi:hypothetical protein